MNQHKISVIKEEFGDDLTTPLEGWSAVTGDIIPPVTKSSRPLSPSTSQSVSNQPSPPVTTSNDTTTSTSPPFNVNKNYPSIASSVRANPPNGRQGPVKKFERNNTNNRPVISTRSHKFIPISSNLQQTSTEQFLELHLKHTQELLKAATDKLDDNKTAYKVLEKKYDELQLENTKLHDELSQLKHHQVTLKAQIDAQTQTGTSQAQMFEVKEEMEGGDESRLIDIEALESTLDKDDQIGDGVSRSGENAPMDTTPAHPIGQSQLIIRRSTRVAKRKQTDNEQPNQDNDQNSQDVEENDSGGGEVIPPLAKRSQTSRLTTTLPPANTNEDMNLENGLVDKDKGNTEYLNDEEEMSITANDNHDQSVVESNEPSASDQQSNRIVNSKPPPTGFKRQNLSKRKQSTRSVKKSKIEDEHREEEKEEDDDDDKNRVDDKIKVLHFNCTEQNCVVESKSLEQLQDHLRAHHRLLPLQCFALNCTVRLDNRIQMVNHTKGEHSTATTFVCPLCRKEFASQKRTCDHWNKNHLIGQFQCNLNGCDQVYDTRLKVHNHQRMSKHYPESSRFQCLQVGCTASFLTKQHLEQHALTHTKSKPFQCTWTECTRTTNRLSSLVRHIRVRHFGLPGTLKQQTAKNIADDRDPNEYVRVVEANIVD